MIVRVVNTGMNTIMKSKPPFSPRYSSLIERGKMSGEPDITEKVSQQHRMPPTSPSASLRRNSLHSPENSYSSLRRSSTSDSAVHSPSHYYSSASHLTNSLRRSATNQSPGSHYGSDLTGSTSETPASYSRYSSLLDDKPDLGWGTLPRRNSKQFQHDDIKF